MRTRIRIGLLTIVVVEAFAQRARPVMGHLTTPGTVGVPFQPIGGPSRSIGVPSQPIYAPHPVQPGIGRGGSANTFRHHQESPSMVGTVPYLVPIPVSVGSADDEQ